MVGSTLAAGNFAQYLPPLGRGAEHTLVLSVISGVLGTAAGLLLGVSRTAPLPPLRWISATYTNIIRGIPPLIILLFMYFALPILFPAVTFSRQVTAVIGLSVYAAAYIAEIVRGSIGAIPAGQSEASEALGMNYYVRFRYVILPQALKVMVPPGIGFLISLVKASALASVIGYTELTEAGHIISTQNQEPLNVFMVVAFFYFLISYPLALLGRWFERRLA